MSQNISIVDYCLSRKNELRSFQHSLDSSVIRDNNISSNLGLVKKRTASFKRYSPSRKRRYLRQSNRNTGNGTSNNNKYKIINRKKKRRKLQTLQSNPSPQVSQLNRRSKQLETHIWHTKRTKIKLLWGYKIPHHSSQRGIHCR